MAIPQFQPGGFARITLWCSPTAPRQPNCEVPQKDKENMRIGIATDHGGFGLKVELVAQLRAAGHDVTDFGAHELSQGHDYPDFVIPLAEAVAEGRVDRGVAVCGSGVGASVCANKIPGI